jgi:Fe-S oxidoreductase
VSLVGVDPSMTLSFRSEYVRALGKEAVPHVSLPQEWLAQRLGELPPREGHRDRLSMTLLPHCTERTNAPDAITDWIKVGKHFGIDTVVQASGCCGMAGLYGHETSNRKSSEDIYGLSWKGILANTVKSLNLVATGYSCRTQVKIMEGDGVMHPIQLILTAVRR